MSKIWYCPVCGSKVHANDSEMNRCKYCNTNIAPMQSKYNKKYYKRISEKQYNSVDSFEVLYNEEIKNNPDFDKNLYLKVQNSRHNNTSSSSTTNQQQQQYTPKCPVCQSPNINKISGLSRAVHGLTFGLFSKTARSQWVCNSCGNKW